MSDDFQLLVHQGVGGELLPPMPREEMIIPSGRGAAAQRELYSALMTGFGDEEQDQLERLMIDNIARLRDDGDSYAP